MINSVITRFTLNYCITTLIIIVTAGAGYALRNLVSLNFLYQMPSSLMICNLKKTTNDYTLLVSLIHALVVTAVTFPFVRTLDWSKVELVNASVRPVLLFGFCTAYFLYDVLYCTKNIRKVGIVFMAHSIVSFLAIQLAIFLDNQYATFAMFVFLSSEMSTIFLNLRSVLVNVHYHGVILKLMNLIFMISFVYQRLYIAGYRMIALMAEHRQEVIATIAHMKYNNAFLRIVICSTVFWQGMNFYWLMKILQRVIKDYRSSVPSAEKKNLPETVYA